MARARRTTIGKLTIRRIVSRILQAQLGEYLSVDTQEQNVQAVIQRFVKEPARDERKQWPLRRRYDLRARTRAAKPPEQPRLIAHAECCDVSQDQRTCLVARKFEWCLWLVPRSRLADVGLQQKQDSVCRGGRPLEQHIVRARA